MSEPSPPPSEAVIQTAARLLAAGRAAEAADRLRQLVDEAPTYAAAHVLLASALDASGHTSKALEAWRRAAFLVPQSPLVHRERQRLVDAYQVPPSEDPAQPEAIPTETWDEVTPEPTQPALETPDATSDDELATDSNEASPIEVAPEANVPLASATQAAAPEPKTAPPGIEPAAEEPIEMPLLPPEGDASSMPRPSPTAIELEEDGWAILEDDMVPPTAETPITAALLSPEPESTLRPVARPEPPEPEPIREPEPDTSDSNIADDLDDLITQLDSAPRIKPDPTFSGPKVTFNNSSMDDMVSETLAKIYAAQHQYVEAAVVYEKLAEREPDLADTLLERAAEMRDKAR